MIRASGSPLTGNLTNFTTAGFARLWPDYVMIIPEENIVSAFSNNNGTFSTNVNSWVGTPKVPSNAKGLILDVSCIIQAVGVINTLNQSRFQIFTDGTFTQIVQEMSFQVFEFAAVAANTTIGKTNHIVYAPIVGGKIFYGVSGSKAVQNFDQFLIGYWDT